MKKVLLIINPNSGRLKNKSMLFDIISIMSEQGCIVTTCITSKVGDSEIFAKQACEEGIYDCIVCSGGDGTLNETVAGVVASQNKLPIGYIPSGSTNDFARSMGLSSDFKEATLHAVTGNAHPIDIGNIDGKHFNYIASFGAFTSVSYMAPQALKKLMGHMAYVLAGIKDIAKIKAIRAEIEFDGRKREGEYIFGAVTNSTSIGGIVQLDDTLVGFNDGIFEVCLVKKPKNPADLTRIVMGALNSDFTGDEFEFFRAAKLTFTFDQNVDWSLDGEKYEGGTNAQIEVIPSAVELVLSDSESSPFDDTAESFPSDSL